MIINNLFLGIEVSKKFRIDYFVLFAKIAKFGLHSLTIVKLQIKQYAAFHNW